MDLGDPHRLAVCPPALACNYPTDWPVLLRAHPVRSSRWQSLSPRERLTEEVCPSLSLPALWPAVSHCADLVGPVLRAVVVV